MAIVDLIAGARPNFMKAAALFAVAPQFPTLEIRLIHTGQHYDALMSDVFFKDLGLPDPVCHLGVGSGSHTVQTARIMEGYEKWVEQHRPDLCMVVGDVNSTVACRLVAAKEHLPVAHVEAGLRSFDRGMPEEVNRVITNAISDLLFVTEQSGIDNPVREGHSNEAIHLVGNVMIDTLLRMLPRVRELDSYRSFGVESGSYAYLTLHRPSNVDDPQHLAEICRQLAWVAEQMPVIFVVHPRTRARLASLHDRVFLPPSLKLVEPFGYLDSLCMTANAKMVVTDSGRLQEETSALGVPCLTLRENTERPVTVVCGTNILIAGNWPLFRERVTQIDSRKAVHECCQIPYRDGHAAERILRICEQRFDSRASVSNP
ncbi:MAG: UDP-N-acetylglucosamine 2-epimerase (non-hydrolyzing) [Terracidiphilus sp.]